MPGGARWVPLRNGTRSGSLGVWNPTEPGTRSSSATLSRCRRHAGSTERKHAMDYGIGGILILILVILAIIYFAKRV